MNEREFEDIICKYPELLEDGLSLKGRQVTVEGKRVDLLFEDKHGYTVIVELKKGIVVRKDTSQLLDYEGYFLSGDDPNVRVMLVGNRVPENLRRSLDHHGFEWRELPITFLSEFLRNRNDVTLLRSLAGEERRTGDVQTGEHNVQPYSDTEESMPEEWDIFKGRVNDLSLDDAQGWRRRDIWFFKHEVNRKEKFGYPNRHDKVVLIDTDGDRYNLNFSKPDLEDRVCLGTPSRLKPWYRKKGFDERTVNPDDRVYFEYTGQGIEFIILTEQEYRLKYNK